MLGGKPCWTVEANLLSFSYIALGMHLSSRYQLEEERVMEERNWSRAVHVQRLSRRGTSVSWRKEKRTAKNWLRLTKNVSGNMALKCDCYSKYQIKHGDIQFQYLYSFCLYTKSKPCTPKILLVKLKIHCHTVLQLTLTKMLLWSKIRSRKQIVSFHLFTLHFSNERCMYVGCERMRTRLYGTTAQR